MHRLLERQLAKAQQASGAIDLDALVALVNRAYDEADIDRRRTDRSIGLMADELQRANTRLLEAFDVVPEGLVLLNPAGRYLLFNKKFLELYDTAADMIRVGSSFEESVRAGVERGHYLDAIGRERDWLIERLAKIGQASSIAEQHIRGDRWVRVEERRTSDGGSIGVRIDITDLKRRERALRERSEQLLEAQRIGKTGDWSIADGQPNFWLSQQIYELLGYDPTTFEPSCTAVMALCEGDDAAVMMATQAEVRRSGQARAVDIKVRRGDGTVCDLAVASKPIVNAAGKVIGLRGTIQDISDRKRAETELARLAYYDPLTGLANRARFQKDFETAMGRCRETSKDMALLLLDLDGFKEVNDSLGHGAGDELLVAIARLVAGCLTPGQSLFRLGGDEFAIIVEGWGDVASLARLAGKIVASASSTVRLNRGEVTVGTSIGIARFPTDGMDAADLQRHADLALYAAKDTGRGRFCFFDVALSASAQKKVLLARELRRALSEGLGLDVWYQPQVKVDSGEVVGFEALARWTHSDFGVVPPSIFIPIAENSNLICDLGLWVLRRAAGQAKAWLDAGEPPREISVNVSAAQIWQTDIVSEVAGVLHDIRLPAHLLCLELTESLLADHAEGRVRRVLTQLKELGVTLALDDFGTAYSGLGYLNRLPFDKIKIDRMFVGGIEAGGQALSLLGGIIALGRGLNFTIVAEGAETAGEVRVLSKLNCDLVQGYAYAAPSPASEVLAHAAAIEARRNPEDLGDVRWGGRRTPSRTAAAA